MDEERKFPNGFLWGSATSSYQVEGGIENNDWARPTLAWPNLSGYAQLKAKPLPLAGLATDHYNRYEEDFDIAKSLGQNAHRFSIEWARVEPEEGRFDEGAIEHYRKVLTALRERGLEPFVTLWHFTLPIWFAKMGGFENKKAPFYFGRYCEYVVRQLAASAKDATASQRGIAPKFWITINEPMVYAGKGYGQGVWPPFKTNFIKLWRVVDNLITSHNTAYQKIKVISPDLQVGIAKNNMDFDSSRFNLVGRLIQPFRRLFWNHYVLKKISRHQDFIGLNFYFHKHFGYKFYEEKSDMGWPIYPPAIYHVLLELKKYHKPIYITENGIADAADIKRAKFIRDHLRWVWQAIHPVRSLARAKGTSPVRELEQDSNADTDSKLGTSALSNGTSPKDLGEATSNGVNDGCDVRGYFYWSLLDNFEWAHGFSPRFGLVEINYDTLERRIRPSAYEYKKICESNTLEPSP